MKLKTILGVLFIIFIIFGYIIYNIFRGEVFNRKDLLWQPYKVGDELMFESNYGQIDKFEITEIIQSELPARVFSVIPAEIINVRIQRTLVHLPKKKDDSYNKYDYNQNGIHTTLLTLDANDYFGAKDYEKSLNYWVELGVDKQKIKNLNVISKNKPEIKIEKKGKYFTTYEIIDKKYGIVSYGYKHKNWKLKQFVRNGINIYKKTMPNKK